MLKALVDYCREHDFTKTADALTLRHDGELVETKSIAKIFNKHFDKPSGLSFTFNLNNCRKRQRDRIRDAKCQQVHTKQRKVTKDRSKDVPEQFLRLLDDLGLDIKCAKILYQNKDHWNYVKSDRKIYCVEQGCSYSTTMAPDCLSLHCDEAHRWRKITCLYSYCKFEAYNGYTHKERLIITWPHPPGALSDNSGILSNCVVMSRLSEAYEISCPRNKSKWDNYFPLWQRRLSKGVFSNWPDGKAYSNARQWFNPLSFLPMDRMSKWGFEHSYESSFSFSTF